VPLATEKAGYEIEQGWTTLGNPPHPSAHKNAPVYVLYGLILKTHVDFKNGDFFTFKSVDFNHLRSFLALGAMLIGCHVKRGRFPLLCTYYLGRYAVASCCSLRNTLIPRCVNSRGPECTCTCVGVCIYLYHRLISIPYIS